MKLERILCPIDFSEPSTAALEHAAFFAQAHGATVVPLHVVEPILFPSEYGALLEAPREVELAAAANAKQALDDLVSVVLKGQVPVASKVVIAHARDAICAEMKDGHYDLVVLGTHGHHGLKRLVLGSVAEHVVRHATCPVLTVKAPANVPAA